MPSAVGDGKLVKQSWSPWGIRYVYSYVSAFRLLPPNAWHFISALTT